MGQVCVTPQRDRIRELSTDGCIDHNESLDRSEAQAEIEKRSLRCRRGHASDLEDIPPRDVTTMRMEAGTRANS